MTEAEREALEEVARRFKAVQRKGSANAMEIFRSAVAGDLAVGTIAGASVDIEEASATMCALGFLAGAMFRVGRDDDEAVADFDKVAVELAAILDGIASRATPERVASALGRNLKGAAYDVIWQQAQEATTTWGTNRRPQGEHTETND